MAARVGAYTAGFILKVMAGSVIVYRDKLTLVSPQRATEGARETVENIRRRSRQTDCGKSRRVQGELQNTSLKMGVEIETITPGDGKATSLKGNVFVLILRCMFALVFA